MKKCKSTEESAKLEREKFICKKCSLKSEKEKNLCKPKKIKN